VGIGKAFNGGFGLVLDGTDKKDHIIRSAMEWDVMNGISRRAWARNPHAMEVASGWNERNQDKGHITLPYLAEDHLVEGLVSAFFK
jgi:urocanate hydratase